MFLTELRLMALSCVGQRMSIEGLGDGRDVRNTGGGWMMNVCEAWVRLAG